MRKLVLLLVLLAACATDRRIRTVKDFQRARQRGDDVAAEAYLNPDSRMWFEIRSGAGSFFGNGGDAWRHCDSHFHSQSTFREWQAHDGVVSATVMGTPPSWRQVSRHPAGASWKLAYLPAGSRRS